VFFFPKSKEFATMLSPSVVFFVKIISSSLRELMNPEIIFLLS